MNRQTIHRGAVAAGDPETLAFEEACACAKLELIAYPVRVAKQTPGQTMSITALAECLKLYGRDMLVTAFQCVTETSNGEEPATCLSPRSSRRSGMSCTTGRTGATPVRP
jgi:hypothetical protein